MKRRDLMKLLGAAAGTAAISRAALARTRSRPRSGVAAVQDPVGVLVDTTRCIGCRTCEFACAEANHLPQPDGAVIPSPGRDTSTTQYTVVRGFKVDGRDVFVKRQCMHCLEPACASACATKAMRRTPDGPVTWQASKCMGCRYCMVACPFEVPRFEFHSAVPRIVKCQECFARVAVGEQPACVARCPTHALTFGRRENLLDEARRRIYGSPPGTYVPHIYGEQEAGGTSWLYLSAVPFERIGFRTDLATEPYPGLAKEFLYAVPQVDVLLPMLLLGIARATQRNGGGHDGGDA